MRLIPLSLLGACALCAYAQTPKEATAATSAAQTQVDDTAVTAFNLKRTPSVGDSFKYRLTIIFTLYGNDVVYKSLLTDKVINTDKDGSYTVQTNQSEVSATQGDRELAIDSKNQKETTTVYGPFGDIVELRGEQAPEAWRIANMSAVRLPNKTVKVGDTWTASVPAVADRNTPGATVTYKVIGHEQVGNTDAVIVSESYKESAASNPASSEGKVWISPTTGAVVKLESDWRNAPVLGLSSFVNAHVTYVREP